MLLSHFLLQMSISFSGQAQCSRCDPFERTQQRMEVSQVLLDLGIRLPLDTLNGNLCVLLYVPLRCPLSQECYVPFSEAL